MSTIIAQREAELLKRFEAVETWEDRYQLIIQLGKALPELPENYRTENFKVRGCQSQVWMFAELRNDLVHFFADSDALIVRGLIAALLKIYQDVPPEELVQANFSVFEKIGLQANLSPSRANGFQAMMKQIKMYAVAFMYQKQAQQSH